MKLSVNSIESFGAVDGPGIRVVVFLSGCSLRCKYCHNPEMFTMAEPNYTPEDLVSKIIRYKPYFKNGGGVTFSGGEPLMQTPALLEVCKLLKNEGIHIALDTAGQTSYDYKELLDYILEINDKEKSIIIVKNLKISNKLFNEKIDQLLNLVEKYDLQYEAYFLNFLARHKSKKLKSLAYKLIDNSTFKEHGIDLLIANHSKEDTEYLYRYFKSASFNFKGHKSHDYVSNIIKYFNNGGKDEKIKSLLIYYYENNFCSYCRKEIIDIMKKFNLLTDEIINEMKYDCNYDIRKMAKKC